jgi:hypothetical protein
VRTLASGWCPKHDRVYQRTDRCPDCGTALVPVEPPLNAEAKQPLVEDPPVAPDAPPGPPAAPAQNPPARFGRWPRRGTIALALVAAFGLGSMLPRNEPSRDSLEPVARETRPGRVARSIEGTAIRLELVRQTAAVFSAVFVMESGAIDPRQIEDAAVEVTTGRSEFAEETYSVDEVTVRPSRAGFTVDGTLQSQEPIRELRITSIQVLDNSAPEWGADLSSVWPVGAEEPRVLRVAGRAEQVEGGTVRLTALVCWRDRIEAVFALRDDEGEPGNRSELAGFELRTAIPNTSQTLVGRAIASSDAELTSAGQLIVRFELIPENADRVVILASRVLDFVAGPWIWRLP